MSRNVNCTFHVKFEHNTNREGINISLAYIQSLDNLYEPDHEKMCHKSYANNKGADQPAHPRSLISAFVVRGLGSIISLNSIAEIS